MFTPQSLLYINTFLLWILFDELHRVFGGLRWIKNILGLLVYFMEINLILSSRDGARDSYVLFYLFLTLLSTMSLQVEDYRVRYGAEFIRLLFVGSFI
jgi:hypothetical protein